jgi:hypothetical protein
LSELLEQHLFVLHAAVRTDHRILLGVDGPGEREKAGDHGHADKKNGLPQEANHDHGHCSCRVETQTRRLMRSAHGTHAVIPS